MGETYPKVTIEELKELLIQIVAETESPASAISEPTLQRARNLIELFADVSHI